MLKYPEWWSGVVVVVCARHSPVKPGPAHWLWLRFERLGAEEISEVTAGLQLVVAGRSDQSVSMHNWGEVSWFLRFTLLVSLVWAGQCFTTRKWSNQKWPSIFYPRQMPRSGARQWSVCFWRREAGKLPVWRGEIFIKQTFITFISDIFLSPGCLWQRLSIDWVQQQDKVQTRHLEPERHP